MQKNNSFKLHSGPIKSAMDGTAIMIVTGNGKVNFIDQTNYNQI